MRDKKNYKIQSELKRIGPKLKWFLFTEMQDLKLTSDYIDFICSNQDKNSGENSNPVEELRNLVEKAIVREFSPKIKNMQSYEHLVDSVMHNIQKKSLQADDEFNSLFND